MYELDEKELAFLLHNRGECKPGCKYCRLRFAYESTMSGTSGHFDDIENLIGVAYYGT
jgi:hypothetical protein